MRCKYIIFFAFALKRTSTLNSGNGRLHSLISVAHWPHWQIMCHKKCSAAKRSIRTVSLRTACSGNLRHARIRSPTTRWTSLIFSSFRFLFGGSFPHYFYKLMEKTLVGRTKLNQLLFLAAERLLYTPTFQALSLYTLAIFEVRDSSLTNIIATFNGLLFDSISGQNSRHGCAKFDGSLLANIESKLDVFIVAGVHQH